MELPRPLSVLLQPLSAFDQPRTSLPIALGIVLLVATVHTGSLWITAGVFGNSIDETILVENENRPSEHMCQMEHWHGTPPEWYSTPQSCNAPKRVPLDLGDHASKVISIDGLLAGFAVFLAWPLLAWLVHFISINVSDRKYIDTLAATAWAFVPTLLPALARPVIFSATADTYAYPNTLDALARTVESLAIGFGSLPFTAVCLIALCWQGYVLFGICTGLREGSIRSAAVIVTISIGLFLGGNVFSLLSNSGLTFGGIFLVLLGLFSATFARGLLILDARSDLIGMRGTRHIEPATWYVRFNQIVSVVIAVFGLLLYGGFSYVI